MSYPLKTAQNSFEHQFRHKTDAHKDNEQAGKAEQRRGRVHPSTLYI